MGPSYTDAAVEGATRSFPSALLKPQTPQRRDRVFADQTEKYFARGCKITSAEVDCSGSS